MWIFHPKGFCSVVEHHEYPSILIVRSRVRKDLKQLFPGFKIHRSPKSDYLFRCFVGRKIVADKMAELAMGIDYGNFKNACPEDRGSTYSDIWYSMLKLQEGHSLYARSAPVLLKPSPENMICVDGMRRDAKSKTIWCNESDVAHLPAWKAGAQPLYKGDGNTVGLWLFRAGKNPSKSAWVLLEGEGEQMCFDAAPEHKTLAGWQWIVLLGK